MPSARRLRRILYETHVPYAATARLRDEGGGMRPRSSGVRSDRKIAEGREVTERNLGSSPFVHRPASRSEVTDGNLGFPLFVHRPNAVGRSPKGREVTEGNLGFPLFVYRLRRELPYAGCARISRKT